MHRSSSRMWSNKTIAQPHTKRRKAARPMREPHRKATTSDIGLSLNGYRTPGDVPAPHRAGDWPSWGKGPPDGGNGRLGGEVPVRLASLVFTRRLPTQPHTRPSRNIFNVLVLFETTVNGRQRGPRNTEAGRGGGSREAQGPKGEESPHSPSEATAQRDESDGGKPIGGPRRPLTAVLLPLGQPYDRKTPKTCGVGEGWERHERRGGHAHAVWPQAQRGTGRSD